MKTSTHKKIIYSSISILLLILAWELLAFSKNEPTIFPHVTGIFEALIRIFNKSNFVILLSTLLRVIISVVFSFIVSIVIGFLYIWKKESFYFFKPIISIMRSTPQVILSIFLFILFDDIAPYIITILVILPVATEGILTAIDNIDPVLDDDLRLIDCNLIKKLVYVYIPLIKDYLLMVFVQIFGLGFKVMIMGEYISYTKNSIGNHLYGVKGTDMPELIAWGVIAAIVVIIVEALVNLIVNKINSKPKVEENLDVVIDEEEVN